MNARGSRRQWSETTKPGRGGGRECSRCVLHPPLPLSLTGNLRLLPNVRPWADKTSKPGVFVRHCASLSTSIIHEGSRVHRGTCASCTRWLYLHNNAGREEGGGLVGETSPNRPVAHQHIVASRTRSDWEARLCLRPPPLCLPGYLPPSHSPSLASLPSLQRCRTSVLVCRLPQGRWWDVRNHFPGWSRRRLGEDGTAQPAPG